MSNPSMLTGKQVCNSDVLLLNLVEANATGNPIQQLILPILWEMWLVYTD